MIATPCGTGPARACDRDRSIETRQPASSHYIYIYIYIYVYRERERERYLFMYLFIC